MLAFGKEVVLSSSRLFLFAKLLLFTCLGKGKRCFFFYYFKEQFLEAFPLYYYFLCFVLISLLNPLISKSL